MAKITQHQESSDPGMPSASEWHLYFKSGGLFIEDSSGNVIGPLQVPAPGTSGNIMTSNGSIWTSTVPAAGGELKNILINGGFDIAQTLNVPATLTTLTDKKFGADRWRTTRENTDVQYNVNNATGETGLTSLNYGTFKKITTTGKIFVSQITEGINSVPLRSKTIIFQLKMKASASKTIRMGIFELQNAGTIDTPPATLVTAFEANTVDPTMAANIAVITAAQSKSVTTSWQSFSVSVTVPSNSKNILCCFWTDSQFAVNDTLSVAEAGLFVASAVQAWTPRTYNDELLLCQRFYISLAVDDALNTNLLLSNVYAYSTTNSRGVLVLPVPMRIKTPATTVKTIANWYLQEAAGNFAASAYSIIGGMGSSGILWISITNATATAGQAGVFGTSTAGEWVEFDAEI